MKILAWIVLVALGLVLFGLVYYLAVGAILFRAIFSRKSLSARILRKDIDQALKDYKVDLCWWDKVKFSKVQTLSFDQLNLVGHYLDAQSNKTAIVLHGFGQDYREMQPYCKFFYEKNFNVLVVDNRGHGESDGHVGFGWLDGKDVCSWIKYLNKNNPRNNLVLFGLSMGATAVCCAAGEGLPNNVKAIVSDCAFSNADKQIRYMLRAKKLLNIFFKKHLYDFAKRVRGFDIMQIDAEKAVKNSQIPIMFIHGKKDVFVLAENSIALYNASKNREILLVENAAHAMSYAQLGVIYEKKICDFLKSRTNIF